MTDKPVMRFAALCHDLGKATTAKDLLPSHHGHEERGADITTALADRLRIPNDYRDLAVLTARYHTHCHRALELKTTSVLKLLSSLDAFRRPDRFEYFLLVCEADARGRKGFEDRSYPQANFLRDALKTLLALDSGSIAKSAQQQGNDVATDIRDARLTELKRFTREYKP